MAVYESIQGALNGFVLASPTLSGLTYDSAKAYSSQLLIPLLKACILLDEAIKRACEKLPSEYRSRVDSVDLKESDLVAKIARADRFIGRYMDLISLEYHKAKPNYSHISRLREAESQCRDLKMKLEEKLQKLRAYNSASSHLFSEIDGLYQHVQQGLSQAKTSWQAGSRSFSLPSRQELAWAKTVEKKWDKREFEETIETVVEYLIKPDIISKTAGGISPYAKTGYTMVKNYMGVVSKDYTKSSFMKYGKTGRIANDNLAKVWREVKKFARSKEWKWYEQLGKKWKKGSFNQFLNTLHHSVLNKASNFKVLGKYPVKKLNKVLGHITDPIKSSFKTGITKLTNSKIAEKLKFLGKGAKVLGWVTMGVDVGITTVREYNDKTSRAYGSEGKALIHAGVAQLKSAGPIEGALLGAKGGPWGAAIGFGLGTFNTIWGIVSPDTKDTVYKWAQNKLDDTYDTIANTDIGKSIYDAKETVKKEVGKAIKGTWDSVSNWFRGGVEYGW